MSEPSLLPVVRENRGSQPYYVLACSLALVLIGCGLRKPHFVGSDLDHGSGRDYADMQPGWGIQVVTPVLKSGGYKPQLTEGPRKDGGATFTTNEDFVGYETSYYAVKARDGGGVRIEFISAWVTKQSRTTRRPYPLIRLFEFPVSARLVRLVYMVRVSRADHNMAIVAASNVGELNDLTERVRTNPEGACQVDLTGGCKWVPDGIGIQIEKKR
jgi:hypothetical protein